MLAFSLIISICFCKFYSNVPKLLLRDFCSLFISFSFFAVLSLRHEIRSFPKFHIRISGFFQNFRNVSEFNTDICINTYYLPIVRPLNFKPCTDKIFSVYKLWGMVCSEKVLLKSILADFVFGVCNWAAQPREKMFQFGSKEQFLLPDEAWTIQLCNKIMWQNSHCDLYVQVLKNACFKINEAYHHYNHKFYTGQNRFSSKKACQKPVHY